jgi:hypothetical protein
MSYARFADTNEPSARPAVIVEIGRLRELLNPVLDF